MKMNHTKKALMMLAIATLMIGGCKTAKAPKKSGGTDGTPTPVGTYTASEVITIMVNGSSTSSLYVALNKAQTWTFTASSSDGSAATVSSVVPATTPSGMIVSGTTVNFTPTTEAALNGSFNVTASKPGGVPQTTQIYWAKDPTSTSSSCTQTLLTQAIAAFIAKQYDANNIPALFQACSQNLLNLFNKG